MGLAALLHGAERAGRHDIGHLARSLGKIWNEMHLKNEIGTTISIHCVLLRLLTKQHILPSPAALTSSDVVNHNGPTPR